MRVVCDNCQAVYQIPDDKLVKPVNKATCRACGHRMLIPRPTDAADDEQTLIKAQPVTPREDGDRERATVPIEDDQPEETLPRGKRPGSWDRTGRGPVPARPRPSYPEFPILAGTPTSAQKRSGPTLSPSQDDENTVWVKSTPIPSTPRGPAPRPATPARPSSSGRRRDRFDRGGVTPDEQPTRPSMPPPVPPSTPPPEDRRRAEPEGRPHVSDPHHLHDPSADLTLVLLATVCALFGVALLGADLQIGSPWADRAVHFLAMLLAFGGLLTSILVIATGARGRRPAWRFLALAAGGLLSLLVAAAFVGTKMGLEHYSGERPLWSEPAEPPRTADLLGGELPAPEPPEDAVADAAEPETEEVAPPVAPAPAPEPVAAPRPAPVAAPRPAPRPDPVTRPRPEPAPAPAPVVVTPRPEPEPDLLDEGFADLPEPEPEPEPAPPPVRVAPRPAPAPAPAAMDTVPMEVLDLMMQNNLDVKKCFFTYMQAAGALPSRVDVRFTLESSGRAEDVSVVQDSFRGTDLERCLAAAVGSITFPPSSSSSKITYPYIFQ